jgi:hypothetical protein
LPNANDPIMNTILWNVVLAYDFDQPLSEYGFSVRLAKENYWTQAFTQKAILEYKKFMYLAATQDAIMGLMREKPVEQLVVVVIIVGLVIMYALWRLSTAITEKVIPKFYRAYVVPSQQNNTNPDWQYFLLGAGALTPALLPIVRRHSSGSDSSSSDSSSSDSSGCGSSCSSVCGCGGD